MKYVGIALVVSGILAWNFHPFFSTETMLAVTITCDDDRKVTVLWANWHDETIEGHCTKSVN